MDALMTPGTPVKLSKFLSARNMLMVMVLIANGQRTGAVINLTVQEFLERREEEDMIIFSVKHHKTDRNMVLSLVVSHDLELKLVRFLDLRKQFLLQQHGCRFDDQCHFFCDAKGDFMRSNEPARITQSIFGGNVCDMRKATYLR